MFEDLYWTSRRLRWALFLQIFCMMRRKLMHEKKFLQENSVIGSDSTSLIG